MTAAAGKNPQRMCIACRKSQDKKQLLRFVLDPEGRIVLDYRQQLPGRGTYTCIRLECIAAAVKKNGFRRAYPDLIRTAVDAAELQQQTRRTLENRISGLLAIARKSGQLISGSNQVLDGLKKSSPPALMVCAQDISDAMADRLNAAAQPLKIVTARMFDKKTLGHLLGKEERSVVAVVPGALAEALQSELLRYELVREN